MHELPARGGADDLRVSLERRRTRDVEAELDGLAERYRLGSDEDGFDAGERFDARGAESRRSDDPLEHRIAHGERLPEGLEGRANVGQGELGDPGDAGDLEDAHALSRALERQLPDAGDAHERLRVAKRG